MIAFVFNIGSGTSDVEYSKLSGVILLKNKRVTATKLLFLFEVPFSIAIQFPNTREDFASKLLSHLQINGTRTNISLNLINFDYCNPPL